jgi:hypothetical protein
VKIAELPKEPVVPDDATPFDPGADQISSVADVVPPLGDDVLNGLQVADLNQKSRAKYGVDDMVTSGVVVTGVAEGSPADAKGLLRGDVIEIACAERGTLQPLANAGDFVGLAKKLKSDQGVVLLVHHGKTSGQEDRSSMFVYLTPQMK